MSYSLSFTILALVVDTAADYIISLHEYTNIMIINSTILKFCSKYALKLSRKGIKSGLY